MAAEAKKLSEQVEGSDDVDDNDCGSEHVQESNVATTISTDACKREEDVNHPLVSITFTASQSASLYN